MQSRNAQTIAQFAMSCDGIDTSIFDDQWKNLPGGIGCEVMNVDILSMIGYIPKTLS